MNAPVPRYPEWGVFLVRITMGFLFLVHGWQKWQNIGGLIGFFGKIGMPAPGVSAPFIAGLEVVGGILLIVGLATRWIGLLFAIEMAVAAFVVQVPSKGWNAGDLERMLLVGGVLLFLAGAGALAVDDLFATRPAPAGTPRPSAAR